MSPLRSDANDGILTLTIDRPKANAFDLALVGELQSAFKQAARDDATRVIILTGAGRIFGAGQDIDEIKAHGGELSFREHLLKTYNPLVLQIRQIEKPVIAAVNGAAVAGASGHITAIFPEDRGLRLVYGEPENLPLKGAETALGTVPYAVAFLASLECAEVAKILLGRGELLRGKLLVADLAQGLIEVMKLQ